ncbi:PREDICTED: homeobox protein 5-like [Tarenaya hassleriana]|uniref:homeobox protein 5-like n=1 Tax=Tarenaya hassleriana TaxID=28532 RepID=UPI00053C2648|nr:PREDICTED: homeobox protein 5-like [Tarenaya hassleriana]
MGTEIIERIAINPLPESNIKIGFRRIGDRRRCRQSKELTGEDEGRFRVRPMDRFLDKQNIESIRKTMQAQEDIFKHQVRELHRVYSVQKMMMEELKRQRRLWTNNRPNIINLTSQPPTASYNNNSFFLLDINSSNNNNHQSSRERSGSCSAGVDLESPAREISAVDLGRTNGSDLMDESELELTLSVGMSSSSTSRSYHQRETMATTNNNMDMDSTTTSFRSDNCNNNNNNNNKNQDCSGPSTPMSSSSTTLDQEKKRPHWLFQGLSINRT